MKRYRMTPRKVMLTEIRIMEHKLGKTTKKFYDVNGTDIDLYYKKLKEQCRCKGVLK